MSPHDDVLARASSAASTPVQIVSPPVTRMPGPVAASPPPAPVQRVHVVPDYDFNLGSCALPELPMRALPTVVNPASDPTGRRDGTSAGGPVQAPASAATGAGTADLAENRAKLGRPTTLDAGKQREICLLLSAGCSREEAARYIGCGRATIFRAARRDPAFAHALEQAEVNRQYSQLQNVRRAAGQSWRAAAWLLERFDPNRFDRNRSARYTSEDVATVTAGVCKLLIQAKVDPENRDHARRYMDDLVDDLNSRGAIERWLKR